MEKPQFDSYQWQEIFISPRSPNRFGAHPNFFLGVQRLNRDRLLLLPTCPKVKNDLSFTSTPWHTPGKLHKSTWRAACSQRHKHSVGQCLARSMHRTRRSAERVCDTGNMTCEGGGGGTYLTSHLRPTDTILPQVRG